MEPHNEKATLRERMQTLGNRMKARGSHIEINNGSEAIFEGCRGILEYGSEKIRLSMGRQCVTVNGSELSIRNMFSQLIVVEGHISSVEFS